MGEIGDWRKESPTQLLLSAYGSEVRSGMLELSRRHKTLDRVVTRHVWRSKAKGRRRRYF